MIILRISSTPSANAIVLPTRAMKRLELKQGAKVILTDAPGGFRITQHSPAIERQLRAADKIMIADREVLRELSKK